MDRMMKLLSILLLAVGLAATGTAATGQQPDRQPFKQGADYHLVVPVQPTDASRNQVEVIEFFWYGCPHCYAFEPYLENWLAHKPESVLFKRVPAVANPAWKPQARAFYTAQVLGILNKVHKPIFDEIHARHHFLRTEDDFQQFFARFGVSKDQFEAAWNSFAVNTRVKQAAVLGARYRIMGVPTVVVGGMYSTGPTMADSFPQLIEIIDFLTDKRLDSKK
ncbi:MAG TPA: thiol:disulfide interchange protein DsbA/DsbL [Gammaproteobacteria bacterium]|nr:thiol:disulfide interchange protein DsbA/DsbL [Gammaproteobacteria bacterium]